MANRVMSRNERLYLSPAQLISAGWPNLPLTTGGSPVPLVGPCCKFTKLKFPSKEELIVRPDKTGSRTVPAGSAGPRSSGWQIDMSLAANGVAGVVPDCDPLLVSLFGLPATLAAGVSATYSLSDALYYFSGFSFRQPSTAMQRALAGGVVTSASFNFGAGVNVATASYQGIAPWVVDSYSLGSALAADAFGWYGQTYPVEPSSHTTNGNMNVGFLGQVTANGSVLANLKSGQLKFSTGADLSEVFGQYYGGLPEASERDVEVQFSIYDQDDAGTQALYSVAVAKTPISIIFQIGRTAGSIWTFTINGVQLVTADLDDSGKSFLANFSDSRASGSGLDEVSLVLS